ncbi:DinB family protein [Streptomyces diacarni]|uniref:DinB family protein n=1 Tax=Streptomyces diacarni TaxID=2800381 RepID=A0A367EAW8_9ACTN|nr:DinB family protein [Streptomyces diacarni]RCG14487.1 DinB family protein [Streptomyces diacarni]
MDDTRRAVLCRQFDLVWSLFAYHLERLTPGDLLWEPTRHCWTVRPGADGAWVPDFAETEPEPVPVPTMAWLSWHVAWWSGVALDHARGRPARDRTDIAFPGGQPGAASGSEGAVEAATVARLRGLREEWLAALEGLTDAEWEAVAPFPWDNDPAHTVTDMVAWVNAELMKNAAEFGQLRLLRAAASA